MTNPPLRIFGYCFAGHPPSREHGEAWRFWPDCERSRRARSPHGILLSHWYDESIIIFENKIPQGAWPIRWLFPQLDRLARPVPHARAIADAPIARGVKLALGARAYDPADPTGKLFFNIVTTFVEFEAD